MQYGTVYNTAGQYKEELIANAKFIGTPGKGILAAHESTGTIGKRFDTIGVENNHDNRQAYRQLLFEAPGIEEHISGVIMYDETLRDSTKEGKPFVDVLRERNILCGIKVDTGLVEIGGTDGETATQGLDGLGKRCAEYYKIGARFAKWRAVLKITPSGCPTQAAIQETARGLARYGSISNKTDLFQLSTQRFFKMVPTASKFQLKYLKEFSLLSWLNSSTNIFLLRVFF